MATPPEACTRPCPIARAMAEADAAWRAALRAITVADLARSAGEDSGPTVLANIGAWLTGPGGAGSGGIPHD
jgi:DNA-binding IscR family transcriptional regulator